MHKKDNNEISTALERTVWNTMA